MGLADAAGRALARAPVKAPAGSRTARPRSAFGQRGAVHRHEGPARRGPLACAARANTSLPTPDSPCSSSAIGLSTTRRARGRSPAMVGSPVSSAASASGSGVCAAAGRPARARPRPHAQGRAGAAIREGTTARAGRAPSTPRPASTRTHSTLPRGGAPSCRRPAVAPAYRRQLDPARVRACTRRSTGGQAQHRQRGRVGADQPAVLRQRQQALGDGAQPLGLGCRRSRRLAAVRASNRRCSIMRAAERTRPSVWRW
jgi:hypothetical protein